ncbi:MAG: ArnT family glycosyltransferase [Rhodomicrobium sp.]
MVELVQAVAVPERDFPADSARRAAVRPIPAKAIFFFVAACALGKAFAAWATGFTGDEAYTVVIARTLALSYFDHPPLHQWTLHGFTTLFGEGWWVRLPFLLMAVATNVPLYGLTRQLFGPDAALWALFAFNAAAYFVVWPDGLILPDTPLFFFLAGAMWAVAEILFGPPRSEASLGALWLTAVSDSVMTASMPQRRICVTIRPGAGRFKRHSKKMTHAGLADKPSAVITREAHENKNCTIAIAYA